MDQATTNKLREYLLDASDKLAELPARIAAEKLAADQDGRSPLPITPLTELDPAVISQALAEIKEVSDRAIQETVGTWNRVCRKYPSNSFHAPSAQVVAVLTLAGIKAV